MALLGDMERYLVYFMGILNDPGTKVCLEGWIAVGKGNKDYDGLSCPKQGKSHIK